MLKGGNPKAERKMEMTNEMKMKMFEKLYELEGMGKTRDKMFYQAVGAYRMILILGLVEEYEKWVKDEKGGF